MKRGSCSSGRLLAGASVWALAMLCGVPAVGLAAETGPPVDAAAPSIAGSATAGQMLKSSKGSWSGQKPMSYTYRWSRCDRSGDECKEIPSATKAAHRATNEDVGDTLRVTITASSAAGTASVTSTATSPVAAMAPAKKATPKLAGVPNDGQVLDASGGSWKGTPPLSLTYQWEACAKSRECSPIPGATSSSYRVESSQIGDTLRTIVTASNAAGSASVTSRPSKKVKPGPPVDVAPPSISGSFYEAQTLTAEAGTWAGTAPLTFSYQWLRCGLLGGGCEEVPGATSATYTLGALDVASELVVAVTAHNAQGSATSTSAETSPILALLPSNTVLPSISGLLKEGQLLSVGTGSWSGSEPVSYSYQWQLCDAFGQACSDISEATGSSLTLSSLDIGKTLDVVVTATNVAGSTSVTTSVSGLIEGLLPVNTVLPSISGLLKEGQLLSVATGSWSGSEPVSYSYQWQLCNSKGQSCSDVSEATGASLSLIAADVGDTVDVIVKATNVAGSASVTSAVSTPILGIAPVNTALPVITGILQEGKLLSVSNGSWSGTTPLSYSYQWQLCLLGKCSNISGATGSTLTLLGLEIGDTLDAVVTAKNVAGEAAATSKQTEKILGLL